MKIKVLFVIVFIPFLISCSTYEQLSIDVLMPAKHSFQPEIKSVVLVDNSLAFRGEDIHNITVPEGSYTIDTIWKDDFPKVVLDALKVELEQRSFFDSVYVHEVSLKKSGLSDSLNLSWNMVNELCEKYNAEVVVAIDAYMYQTNIKVEKLYDDNLYGYLDANTAILFTAYNDIDQTIIFDEVSKDTISWSVYGSGLTYIAQNLPSIKNSLADLAVYMGEKSADDMAPFWKTEKRIFYNSGNYYFMQAAEYVRKDDWGEAIKLWKYVFEHSKKKVKSRAAYNLALASEIQGDYQSSAYWIKEGLNVISNLSGGQAKIEKKRLTLYSIYMSQRLNVIEDLKIQIGG